MRKDKSIITFLTLLGLLFAVTIESSHAFYRSNIVKNEDIFEREKYGVPFDNEASALAVYENVKNAFSSRRQQFPPHSKHFVCFDKLDYNLPIIVGLYPPRGKFAEENLNDFLYSNLMTKMLLDKYLTLQENTRKLISGKPPANRVDTVNTSRRPITPIGRHTEEPQSRIDRPAAQPSGILPAIHQAKQNLDIENKRAMWRASSIGGSTHIGSHILWQSNSRSLAALVSQVKTTAPDYHNPTNLSDAARGAMLAVKSQTIGRERNSNRPQEHSSMREGATSIDVSGRTTEDYSDHSQSRWVINIFTAAMEYVSNNKKSALFFGSIILGFVGFMSCLGRR